MRRVVLDVDTGVDDALALILALRSPELQLEAATTLAGNAPLEATTRNTRLVLEVAQAPSTIPVAPGAARPLVREPVNATMVHGADGLGNVTGIYPAPKHPLADKNAASLLVELIDRYRDQLTIIAVGPMTNLAEAARQDLATFRRAGEIVQMGGAVRVSGNITPLAEFNVYVDPEAASVVWATGVRCRLLPLDVTTKAPLMRHELRRLAQERDSAVFQFVREITVVVFDFYQKFVGLDGFHLHDPMAVAAVVDPTLFTWETMRLEVRTDEAERGHTVESPAGARVTVATNIEGERFLRLFADRVCR